MPKLKEVKIGSDTAYKTLDLTSYNYKKVTIHDEIMSKSTFVLYKCTILNLKKQILQAKYFIFFKIIYINFNKVKINFNKLRN